MNDLLMMRGWSLVKKRSLCKIEDQSANHILLHCSQACLLYDLLLFLFGIKWRFLSQLQSCFAVGIVAGWQAVQQDMEVRPTLFILVYLDTAQQQILGKGRIISSAISVPYYYYFQYFRVIFGISIFKFFILLMELGTMVVGCQPFSFFLFCLLAFPVYFQ